MKQFVLQINLSHWHHSFPLFCHRPCLACNHLRARELQTHSNSGASSRGQAQWSTGRWIYSLNLGYTCRSRQGNANRSEGRAVRLLIVIICIWGPFPRVQGGWGPSATALSTGRPGNRWLLPHVFAVLWEKGPFLIVFAAAKAPFSDRIICSQFAWSHVLEERLRDLLEQVAFRPAARCSSVWPWNTTERATCNTSPLFFNKTEIAITTV